MFDPFQQAKIQRSYSKLRDTVPEKDMSLDDLKRLSGADKITGESTPIDHELNAKKHSISVKIISSQVIKLGSKLCLQNHILQAKILFPNSSRY